MSDLFGKVNERIAKWARAIRHARGESIVSRVKETVKSLCEKDCFNLESEKIIELFTEYWIREGALQSIKSYRDHFVHSFHTFSLGYYLLHQWREKNFTPFIFSGESLNYDNDDLKLWFITALLHDVGIPFEWSESLVQDYFKKSIGQELKSQFDWSSVILSEDKMELIDTFSELFCTKTRKDNDAKKFKKWVYRRLLENHDHGIFSAFMTLGLGWENKKLAEEAALAIILHSYKHEGTTNIGQLAVEDFPLAFFLSYCDLAQEWGRGVLLWLLTKKEPATNINSSLNYDGFDSMLYDIKIERELGGKVTTKVIIQYSVDDFESVGQGEPLREIRKKLREKLESIANRFNSTWCLKSPERYYFSIENIDKSGQLIARIAPSTCHGPVITSEFEKEKQAFLSQRESLKKEYFGKYVAIYKGEVVDSDTDESALIGRFYAKYGNVPVYIDKITDEEYILKIPTRLKK